MSILTTRASDDDFDKIEQGIDWMERLESIRARRDQEAATKETIQYVDRLREALTTLTGDMSSHQLASAHGLEVAQLIDSIRDEEMTDPWTEYLLPSLLS